MFIAIKLNCRMSQLMIQLKVNTDTEVHGVYILTGTFDDT